MAVEIERKFLLADDSWRAEVSDSREMQQAYMTDVVNDGNMASVRIRIDGDKADINIKSADMSVTRQEYEYPVPLDDARHMIESLCHQPVIIKTRHILHHGDHEWEIDEFAGANSGLVVAEIELGSVEEQFERPTWLGEEVSDDPRYYNVQLIHQPFSEWGMD